MKNALKWFGIILAALIIIGIIFPSETEDTTNTKPSIGAGTQNSFTNSSSSTPEQNNSKKPSSTTQETENGNGSAELNQNKNNTSTDSSNSETITKDSVFSIHFINVGQADAALINCDGHYMLIDGGNKADSNIIYSVLKKANVPKLDIVVGTHAHEDHIGGLPGAFNYTTADLTLCPVIKYDSNAFEDFAKYATQKGNGITVPKVGNTYALGSATVKILGVNSGNDTNNTSIVLRIDYGKTSFLFTGDAEREAEQVILNSGADLNVTVLKVGHHGSDTSTTYPFLREIMPKYAVISVGSGNSYGHPTDDTLSRLRDAGVKVFRTDIQGDVHCTSDGTEVSFSVTKNADADVFGGIGQNSTQTKPSTDSTTTPVADMVWIPKTGKKYHSNPNCSNMKNPSYVTKEQAIKLGYDPCKKCY